MPLPTQIQHINIIRYRSAARLAAVQALYQIEMTGAPQESIIIDILEQRIANIALLEDKSNKNEIVIPLVKPDAAFLSGLVRIAITRQTEIDVMIDRTLCFKWRPKRLENLTRCILRAGVSEFLEWFDIPVRVTITEYVDVAHAFYASPEPSLVNAVLDQIGKYLRKHEFKQLRSKHAG